MQTAANGILTCSYKKPRLVKRMCCDAACCDCQVYKHVVQCAAKGAAPDACAVCIDGAMVCVHIACMVPHPATPPLHTTQGSCLLD